MYFGAQRCYQSAAYQEATGKEEKMLGNEIRSTDSGFNTRKTASGMAPKDAVLDRM
jgi:hypothetical protein